MFSNLTPIKSVTNHWKTQVVHVSDLIANTHVLLDEYQVSFQNTNTNHNKSALDPPKTPKSKNCPSLGATLDLSKMIKNQ